MNRTLRIRMVDSLRRRARPHNRRVSTCGFAAVGRFRPTALRMLPSAQTLTLTPKCQSTAKLGTCRIRVKESPGGLMDMCCQLNPCLLRNAQLPHRDPLAGAIGSLCGLQVILGRAVCRNPTRDNEIKGQPRSRFRERCVACASEQWVAVRAAEAPHLRRPLNVDGEIVASVHPVDSSVAGCNHSRKFGIRRGRSAN